MSTSTIHLFIYKGLLWVILSDNNRTFNAFVGDVEVVAGFTTFVDVCWLGGEFALWRTVALFGDFLRKVHPTIVLVRT